ncbi:MAG: cyclic nucleotide-binding and patatin-like phospholipase domain-containing protein [Candidatus Binatia bacterium]
MFPRDKLDDLCATPFFAAFSPASIDDLLPQLALTQVPGGEILFRAGDDGDAMYVVLSGRMRASVERCDGAEEVIREIARGESIGELALLTGEPRSATIRAIRDTDLATLSRSAFERAVSADPKLIRQIAVQLAARQHASSDGASSGSNVRTIAIIPVDASHDANAFAQLLTAALAAIGPTVRVSREMMKTRYGLEFSDGGENAAGEAQWTARLDALETNHGTIVYQADGNLTTWTKRCIRQADLILLIRRADLAAAGMELDPIQKYLASCAITARIELVLLHRSDADPAIAILERLGQWRAATYHNVVPSDVKEIARLARLITGNAVGLVLSGGGARGFAHIGVIRALQEGGIPIDYIGGTSMGAVIAAQHALGWDWQTMARINREEWPRCQPQKNYTLPLVALNSARRMDQMLQRMFGDVQIQNLRRKFFCVSTNLTTAAAKIHREGLLWKAVRASVSIPGIGPPAIENGEILVDGGLVDNLPVETMKKLCPGQIYAVDVSAQVEFTSKLKESYTVSGWKLLWQQLNPFAEKPDIPNILNTLYRTTTVGGIRAIENAKSQADLCFEPPVRQFGVFEWQSVDKIMEVGYRYAARRLEDSVHHGKR